MKSVGILVIFLGIILFSSTFVTQSFADVISPRQQMKLDFTAEQVICSENLVKIIKSSSGKVSCVKPATAEKLSQLGWAKQLTEQKIEEIKTKKNSKGEPAGTITKIAALKQTTKKMTAGVSTSIAGYSYIFDACANSKVVKTPEIFVTSDSDTKYVKLATKLDPNSCYTSSVIIKASDPNSISATLLNKGGISAKITSLESKISDLKDRISAIKQKVQTSDDATVAPETFNDLKSLKQELKGLQEQLRRYLMVLYVPSNAKATEIVIPKSTTGKPLQGMTTSLVSVTESVVASDSSNKDLKRFNVVFEACADKGTIRLPIITVVSDSDSVDVKLVERIIPNSCQVGLTRINALDSESISTKISGNSAVSLQITNLEKQVEELQTIMSEKRDSLKQLASKKLDASGEESAVQLTMDISELRTELLETRTKLNGLILGL